MATYSTITDGQIDQDSPITQPLMTAFRDNPVAIAEGSSGAPKIADKILFASATSGLWVSVSGLDDFAGCFVDVSYDFQTGLAESTELEVEFSNNGSTWYGTTELDDIGSEQVMVGLGRLFVDFATGAYYFVSLATGSGSNGAQSRSGTISGTSLSITHIRFSVDRGTSIMVQPQGGAAP